MNIEEESRITEGTFVGRQNLNRHESTSTTQINCPTSRNVIFLIYMIIIIPIIYFLVHCALAGIYYLYGFQSLPFINPLYIAMMPMYLTLDMMVRRYAWGEDMDIQDFLRIGIGYIRTLSLFFMCLPMVLSLLSFAVAIIFYLGLLIPHLAFWLEPHPVNFTLIIIGLIALPNVRLFLYLSRALSDYYLETDEQLKTSHERWIAALIPQLYDRMILSILIMPLIASALILVSIVMLNTAVPYIILSISQLISQPNCKVVSIVLEIIFMCGVGLYAFIVFFRLDRDILRLR